MFTEQVSDLIVWIYTASMFTGIAVHCLPGDTTESKILGSFIIAIAMTLVGVWIASIKANC